MSTKFNQGEYVARVTSWGLTESKNKKTPQFVLRFTPIGKINPNDPTGATLSCPNYERSVYRAITKNTVNFLIEDLQYLGYNKASFKYLDPDEEGAHDFSNLEIRVRCDHEEYNGNVQERWNLARDGGAELVPLEGSKVRELDSLFGRTLKDKIKTDTEIDPEPATVDQRTDGDDIPF